jgi:spermidine/putrescine transport system permease protein
MPNVPHRTRGGSNRLRRFAIGLTAAYWLAALVLPTMGLLVSSFRGRDFMGGFTPEWSVTAWKDLFSPVALGTVLRSLGYAGTTTLLCAGLGIPLGIAIRSRREVFQRRASLFILFPVCLNTLLVAYNWQVILGNAGLLNSVLSVLGLAKEPIPFLFNSWSVIVGMAGAYLPFFLLPFLGALSKLDTGYISASLSLGASPTQTILHVVLPMARNGIAVGCLLVFLPCFSEFILPDLLGGGKTFLVGNLMQFWFYEGRNWPAGSALACVILVSAGLLAIPFYRQIRGMFSQEA